MHQARVVGGTQRQYDLPRQPRRTGRFQRSVAHQRFPQSLTARHVLHLDEMAAVDTPQVVDRDHVGMREVRRGARLRPELLPQRRLVLHQAAVDDLQGAIAVQTQVLGLVDRRHRAATQQGLDAIRPDPLPNQPVGRSAARVFITGRTTAAVLRSRLFE